MPGNTTSNKSEKQLHAMSNVVWRVQDCYIMIIFVEDELNFSRYLWRRYKCDLIQTVKLEHYGFERLNVPRYFSG